jgi:MFS family permease
MLPPALASAVMMPISGVLYDRIGPKIPVAVGIIVLAASTFALSYIDLGTALSTIVWINIVRSLGMGLVMMPAQSALMSEIDSEKVGRASSINNILTRVAGSLGIAALTIIMGARTALHSATLTWAVSTTNPSVMNEVYTLSGKLPGGGGEQFINPAVYSLLGQRIFQISFVQSMNDVFIMTAIVTALAIIPGIMLKKKFWGNKTEKPMMIE